MNFDPAIAIMETKYGFIKFYTNSALETYLTHHDQQTKIPSQFKTNLEKLDRLAKTIKTKRGRGRPKGSKNNPKTTTETTPQQKAEKHIVTKEPYETNEEFKKRKREELAEN